MNSIERDDWLYYYGDSAENARKWLGMPGDAECRLAFDTKGEEVWAVRKGPRPSLEEN